MIAEFHQPGSWSVECPQKKPPTHDMVVQPFRDSQFFIACVPTIYFESWDPWTHTFSFENPQVLGFTEQVCRDKMAAFLKGKNLFIKKERRNKILRWIFGPHYYTQIN